ncbi:MAG TPA: TMEM175 family protein [Pyrinomonadaceae bacterium]
MIREKLIESGVGASSKFRWRSREVSRLEGLADAVFGFAITLLVVSLEVPRTFDDLLAMMATFPAFAISFALLLLVWYQHYVYFRRYDIEDGLTMVLNSALLFVVLFYVYPLKFVWTFLANLIITGDPRVRLPGGEMIHPVTRDQTGAMMIVYSLGFVAVFAIFALLYWHAYRRRGEMGLNELEVYDTKVEAYSSLLYVAVGLASVGIAAFRIGGGASPAISGFVYALLGPVHYLHGRRAGKHRGRLEKSVAGELPQVTGEDGRVVDGE